MPSGAGTANYSIDASAYQVTVATTTGRSWVSIGIVGQHPTFEGILEPGTSHQEVLLGPSQVDVGAGGTKVIVTSGHRSVTLDPALGALQLPVHAQALSRPLAARGASGGDSTRGAAGSDRDPSRSLPTGHGPERAQLGALRYRHQNLVEENRRDGGLLRATRVDHKTGSPL